MNWVHALGTKFETVHVSTCVPPKPRCARDRRGLPMGDSAGGLPRRRYLLKKTGGHKDKAETLPPCRPLAKEVHTPPARSPRASKKAPAAAVGGRHCRPWPLAAAASDHRVAAVRIPFMHVQQLVARRLHRATRSRTAWVGPGCGKACEPKCFWT